MLLLGLALLAGGALIILAAVFTASEHGIGHIELLGIEISPLALFLLGVASGLAILWGLSLTRYGAKRELRQRKERRKMDDLSSKLDEAEDRRRKDLDGSDERS